MKRTWIVLLATLFILGSCQGPVENTTSQVSDSTSRDLATPFYDRITWATGAVGITSGLQLDANERVLPIDFNGDGLTDLLAWNMVNHRHCLYRNEGAGVFTRIRDEIAGDATGVTPGFWLDKNEDIYPLNLSHDKFTDFLVRNRVAHTHAIFLADRSGNGQYHSQGKGSSTDIVPDFWLDANEVIVPLDYNGDGITDLLVYNTSNHNQGVYDLSKVSFSGAIDPAPTRVRFYTNSSGSQTNSIASGFWLDANEVVVPVNYDGTAKVGLIVWNKANHNQGLYKSNGDGTFTSVRMITNSDGNTSLVPGFWLDANEEIIPLYLNNDGFQDLIARNKVSHTHAIYYSNGTNNFTRRLYDSGDNITAGFWWDSNEVLTVGNFFFKGLLVNRSDLFVHNTANFNQGSYKNIITE